MGRGKIASQVCHAAFGLSQQMTALELASTLSSTNAIIVLYVSDERELCQYAAKAKRKGLRTTLINDEGITQVECGSTTALGIGPMTDKEGKKLFKGLKLVS